MRATNRAARPANGDASDVRTVYLLNSSPSDSSKAGPAQLTPVSIRIGISDGAFTEVLEGVQEGDLLVTGPATTTTSAGAPSAGAQNNPFAPRRPPRR